MKKRFYSLTVILVVFGLGLSACSGVKSFFSSKSSPKKTRQELWITAREYCLNADGRPDESKFIGGHLCLAEPQDNYRTSEGSVQIAGMLRPFDERFTGINIYAERTPDQRNPAVCQGPQDQQAGCTQTILDTVRDIDTDGAFASSALLPFTGRYTIRVIASFISDTGEEEPDALVERTVTRDKIPTLSVDPCNPMPDGSPNLACGGGISLGSGSPDQRVTFNPSGGDDYQLTVSSPSGCTETPDRLHSARLQVCVYADDGTDTPMASVTGSVKNSYHSRISGTDLKKEYYQSVREIGSCGNQNQGHLVELPLGDGENEITLVATNGATDRNPSEPKPTIKILPFQNALKGPDLCVTYLSADGRKLGAGPMNGKPITEGVEDILVDIAFKKCLNGSTETDFPIAPEDCLNDTRSDKDDCPNIPGAAVVPNTICLQKGNRQKKGGDGTLQQLLTGMCRVEGNGHFQARLGRKNFGFPVTTVTFNAYDQCGNLTEKTESFGLGKIHSLLNEDGTVAGQQLQRSLSAFISQPFIEGNGDGDLKSALEKVLNSDEFKQETFLKVFDPVQPMASEVLQCQGNDHDPYDDTTQDFVKTFKLYPLTDRDQYPTVGNFKIRSLYLLNRNRVWLTLNLDRLEARGDMFTMMFDDTDGDGRADPGTDIDDDNDGLCDDKGTTEGAGGQKCTAPLDADGQKMDDDYDNIKGKSYDSSLRGGSLYRQGGRIVGDRCLDVGPIPIKVQLTGLTLNLELELAKEGGRIKPKINQIVDEGGGWPIVSFQGLEHRPIAFDCDRPKMLTPDENGTHQPINRRQCRALQRLDAGLNNSGLDTTCLNQHAWQQLKSTLENMLTCNVPNRLSQSMGRFKTDRVQQFSFKGLGKEFFFDLYSDFMASEVRVIPPGDPVSTRGGLGLSAPALILPAGVYDEGDTTEKDAKTFMEGLASRLRREGFGNLGTFGPLYEEPKANRLAQQPPDALRDLGRELGISLNEEALNMVLHTVNTALYQVDKDDPTFLDISKKKLRDDFDQAVNDYEEAGKVCRDKEGRVRDEEEGFIVKEGTLFRYSAPNCGEKSCRNGKVIDPDSCRCVDKAPCFPLDLNIEQVLGTNAFPDIDFNGDGAVADEKDGQTPLLLHLSLNPRLGITAKLLNSSDAHDTGSGVPPVITAQLEVGLSNAILSVFEEDGTGMKLSWCHQGVEALSELAECQHEEGKKPLARFSLSGKLTFTLQMVTTPNRDGEYELVAGLATVPGASSLTTDKEKSYLKLSLIEDTVDTRGNLIRSNNSLYSDHQVSQGVTDKINSALSTLTIGKPKTIKVNIPSRPIDELRETTGDDRLDAIEHGEEVSQTVKDNEELIDNLEKFNILDVEIHTPVIEMTPFAPRSLGLGFDLEFCYQSGQDNCQ
ncbi:MAG: hypothetical protein HYS22_02955 [Deltaproteobacteria bacterium]|nr:hypothetical protein [Deltaproteobacteria bacterium]